MTADWTTLPKVLGRVRQLQSEDGAPEGPQLLFGVKVDGEEKLRHFYIPLGAASAVIEAQFHLLLDALRSQALVRITHRPIEAGGAARAVAVRVQAG
jgi:hypothetical protein